MSGEAPTTKKSFTETIYAAMGAVVPSCGDALRMVERGQERPLSLRERFVLKYNSPLCPHCSCKREKFDKELARMREIEAEREKA